MRKPPPPITLLNVSYDPTREFYQEFNREFAAHWRQEAGQTVSIEQSHGGSGKQARAVVDGLKADIVTLALAQDVDLIAKNTKLIAADWQTRLPHNSAPYTSTIILVVRKGNPKRIFDWDDLAREGVGIVAANPKTGGGARWNYLAAWGHKLLQKLGDPAKLQDPAAAAEVAQAQADAREFVGKVYRNALVLDPSARAATNSFMKNEIGDALIAWENEALLAVNEFGKGEYEIVVPKRSILAEPSVALVEGNAEKNGTTAAAEAYLKYLYSPTGQHLAARYYYRPCDPTILTDDEREKFVNVELFTIGELFGGWEQAQPVHFDEGGIFDQIYQDGGSKR